MTDTPIDKNTTDHNVWGAALYHALYEWPAEVNTPEGLASWFATAIEAGRRAERSSQADDLLARIHADRLGGPLHRAGGQ